MRQTAQSDSFKVFTNPRLFICLFDEALLLIHLPEALLLRTHPDGFLVLMACWLDHLVGGYFNLSYNGYCRRLLISPVLFAYLQILFVSITNIQKQDKLFVINISPSVL